MHEINKILYIDDDPDQRAFLEALLPAIGTWRVETVENGEQALQTARTFEPDLILLDVVMPEMDGPATLLYLRKHGVVKPVVFVSAQNDPVEIARLERMDCQGVLVKPFDSTNLKRRIESICESIEVQHPSV